jgi:two-component system, NtrC family, response regulator GlrR
MRTSLRVWVVEDGEGLAPRIRTECPGVIVTSMRRDRIALASQLPNLAVVDASERPLACSSIREIRSAHPDVPVLVVSPASDREPLLDGADDFVFLPFQPGELHTRMLRLSARETVSAATPREDESIREIRRKYRLDAVIGESAALRDAIRKVPRLGGSEANVLITGDTGTGKELFARAIHYASARRARPFVPLNCGALPDTLFENELFGHEKGAYTDASTAGVGLLGVAEHGSLFLDEVNSLSPASQAKLLRVMQDREYRPLGSQRMLRADVRIIAAANTPLAERISAREFRADLYYRLNVLTLRLPTLAERRDDIPLLARHFLARFAKDCGRPAPRLSPSAIRRLIEYAWPGNIRELESVIQRAFVLSDGAVLDAGSIDLPDSMPPPGPMVCDSSLPIADAVYEFERQYLASMLSRHNGNVTHAAEAAGKDRRTFQRLLRRHGIAALSAAG